MMTSAADFLGLKVHFHELLKLAVLAKKKDHVTTFVAKLLER